MNVIPSVMLNISRCSIKDSLDVIMAQEFSADNGFSYVCDHESPSEHSSKSIVDREHIGTISGNMFLISF